MLIAMLVLLAIFHAGVLAASLTHIRTVPTIPPVPSQTSALPPKPTYSQDSCEWEFSPTVCGQGVSYQSLSYPATENLKCIPLSTPMTMKNVWTNNCSSRFVACTMWMQSDCTGEWSMRIDSPSDLHLGTCFSETYYINAISCEIQP